MKQIFHLPVVKRVKHTLLESRKKEARLESISSRKFRILTRIFEVEDNKAFKGVSLIEPTNKRFT